MTLLVNIRPMPVSAIIGSSTNFLSIHTLRFQIQYVYELTPMLSFGKRALSGNGSQTVRCGRGWLGSRYLNLTTLNPPGRKSGCQKKSGETGDGSLVSIPG